MTAYRVGPMLRKATAAGQEVHWEAEGLNRDVRWAPAVRVALAEALVAPRRARAAALAAIAGLASG